MVSQTHQPAITLIHLDPATDTPLHEQIYARLRHVIASGMLGPGMRLPSTRMLATELRVSRNTVLGAFDQLSSKDISRHAWELERTSSRICRKQS